MKKYKIEITIFLAAFLISMIFLALLLIFNADEITAGKGDYIQTAKNLFDFCGWAFRRFCFQYAPVGSDFPSVFYSCGVFYFILHKRLPTEISLLVCGFNWYFYSYKTNIILHTVFWIFFGIYNSFFWKTKKNCHSFKRNDFCFFTCYLNNFSMVYQE